MSQFDSPMNATRDVETARRERKVRWAARVGYWAVQLLARSWRLEIRGQANWPSPGGRPLPVVVAVWHGQMLAPIWSYRNRGVVALASEHGDGEIIARILERLGYAPPARGSSSRGGARGLMTVVAALREGSAVAFTPDGPRGPARVPQLGLFVAAHRAEKAIVPTCMHATRAWHLRSWDAFAIPKPFTRVRVAFGEQFVPRFAGELLVDGEVERFVAAMDATEAMARA